jgi:superfamily II DNA or RNA helicase
MQLRPYQDKTLTEVYEGWQAGARNVLAVLPTGAGKTVLFSEATRRHVGGSCAIAHRQELVGQISLALARDAVKHRIIGPKNVIREIVQQHTEELGQHFYDPAARCAVAGVDTLASWSKPTSKQYDGLLRWSQQVTLWVQDEAHHLLTVNKWGKAVALFPNARGLGVTATPERADGKGLGRLANGIFDIMVEGPGMRELITLGYLTDYRVFCPPSDLDLSTVTTGADGDYIRGQLAAKTQKSSVMGDVVTHYLRHAGGKLGVTFAPDVETATELAARFNAAGVPAEVVSAKTPGRVRREILKRFRRRQILQLVNVDLFGEGFDLPAIEVVSMARATQSYGLFVQQFGRSLRILENKDRAIIFDHVGNVLRHGLPDRPRVWSLDGREKRGGSKKPDDVVPMRVCLNPVCMAPYERVHASCPFCGWIPTPAGRTAPEFVDGDLPELDAATLAALRGEVAKVDRHPDEILRMMEKAGHAYPIAKGAANRHEERLRAQNELRDAVAWWAGHQRAAGRPDAESYRRFYFMFGVDVLTAQTLGRADAEKLAAKINETIGRVAA